MNNIYYNRPKTEGIYSQQNNLKDNGKIDGRKLFSGLTKLRTISMEGKNVLLENESYLHILSFSSIIFGFVPLISLVLDKKNMGFIFILLGFFVSMMGFLICKKVRVYSVFNLSNNSFYQEYRFDSFPLYQSKQIKTSDIIQIGLDHRRERSLTKGFNSGILLMIFYLIQDKEVVPQKASGIDGNCEKTAIVFLTKEGKKINFNNYSGEIDSDDILLELANTISTYLNKALTKAKENEGLTVSKSTNSYKFTMNKLSAGGEIFKNIITVIIIIASVIIGLLVIRHFE